MAAFAIGAVGATAASAQQGIFTSSGSSTMYVTELGGKGNVIRAFGLKIECPESVFTAHKTSTTKETEEGKTHELVPSGVSAATVTADFKQANCKTVEGETTRKATFTMNGCDIDFRLGSTVETNHYSTAVDLVCPTGNDFQVDAYAFAGSELGGIVCTVTVKPQENRTGAIVSNDAGNEDVLLQGTYTGLTASRSGSGCSTSETTVAELELNETQIGTNSAGEKTAISISHN